MFKDVGWNLLVTKKEFPFVQKLFLGDFLTYNHKVEKGLIESTLLKSNKPQFVYAHFLMPHKPYLYDSTGTPAPLSSHFNFNKEQESVAYLSYLKYCNNKIIYYTNQIIQNDPSSIIIVMSDHGRKDYSNDITKPDAPFNNICFIKSNKKSTSEIKRFGSNVNFFRYFLNQNFNQTLPYLKDSSIYLVDVVK